MSVVRLTAALIRMTLIAAVLLGDAAAGGLVVRLDDGSSVTVGAIAGADETALRVAATADRVRVERAIPWARVAGAELDGDFYSRGELRRSLGLTPNLPSHAVAAYCPPPFAAAAAVPVLVPCGPVFVTPGWVVGVRPDPMAMPSVGWRSPGGPLTVE